MYMKVLLKDKFSQTCMLNFVSTLLLQGLAKHKS